MKKIVSKFSFGYLIVVTLLASLIVFISYSTIRSHYIDDLSNDLEVYSKLIETELVRYDIELEKNQINSFIEDFSKKSKVRITIIDKSGIVLFDSDENPIGMENHRNRPEILELSKSEIGHSIRYSNTVQEDMLYVAREIKTNKNQYYLRTSFFVYKMNKLLHEVRTEIIEISIFVYLVSIFGLFIFIKNISNPIKQLSEASKKVAEGDFDVKVKINSNDELGDLSINFNNMTKRLKKLFYKVNSQKEQLDTLISEIQEGLVVLDSKGRIKLYNDSFSELLRKDNLIGKKLTKLIDNINLKKLLEEIVSNDISITREIEVGNRQFLCSTSWIKMKNEVIILLHDISELNKLELIKKDFVINVSHELRTPLTAIKGFSETLIDEIDNAEHKRYVEIISRHTNRLIRIVNDLLHLSELEQSKSNLMLENVKVKVLLESVYNLFLQKSIEKGIKLIISIENKERILEIDNFRIEQLLINLIDNAFKYTDKGIIRISSKEKNNKQVFIIEDTGLGIPKEDINRIFERFYTVDKSRSRRVGGTGLGLSIVKHIVLLHNGKIDIESELNKGTKFIITIPFTQSVIQ
jgi:two-component system phosphate regulon sensor histidine kinase PhoR